MGESGRNPSQYGRERRERRGVYFRAGRAGSPDGGQGWESDHGNADSFGNHLTNAFSAICCLQKSRFTASKPSIFAIASDEKFIRHLVTSFHQRSLSQSAYQNDPTKPNFGTLTATTYGNGAKVSSRYDDFNRVTGVVYGEETAPRYEYDYNAKGQVARVRDNLLNRTTQSEYDLANRPVRVKTSEDAKHVYTGQVAYDNVYGNLSEFTEKVGENRQEFGTKFGYDDENRPTSLTYSASGKEIGQSTTTIDKLNRTTFSAVKLGSKTFTSEYHFAAGGYGTGSVTNLVASITQPGCNCGYGYDDNGNIASATLNGKWTGYTYDALGQLVQVNDHSDTRSGASGTTWKYTYDLGGNILKKERFAYADTTNPLETVTYTYGDANWRDKLTAVNGNAIAYDAIGNPLNDGTWTYTWQNGRQLQKMQKAGVTAEFVYNADGLRVQKTVNGVATKYTLHGKNIVHITSGTDELHFFYDAQNRPAVVVYNGTAYAYVKSLQGDIVAILDENGNTVVSYGYDAWGATLWCTGELAETLGKVQPFRYRGYVFDEETGLYYLRSRYYNPRWGRFINADNYLSTNVFSYCGNVPSVFVDKNGHERKLYDNLSEPWATKLMSQFFDMDSLLQNLNLKFSDGYVVDCYLSEADALRINTINEKVRGKITEPLANIELALKLAFPEEMEEVSASIEDAFTVSSGYYTQYVAYYYQYNDTLGYPLRVGKWRFTINVYEENENGESPVELWADRIPFGSNACIVRTTIAIDTSEPRPKPEWNGSLIPHIYLLHSMNWSE